MRDMPKIIGHACVVLTWMLTISTLGTLFGVLMASSINGGIVW